jgi:hypothetical protein
LIEVKSNDQPIIHIVWEIPEIDLQILLCANIHRLRKTDEALTLQISSAAGIRSELENSEPRCMTRPVVAFFGKANVLQLLYIVPIAFPGSAT